MKFTNKDFNDEMLLAHILGELEADDSRKIENASKEDKELAARIAALKNECSQLEDAFMHENADDALDPKLAADRDEFVAAILSLEKAQAKNARKIVFSKLVRWTGGISVAACLALMLFVSFKTKTPVAPMQRNGEDVSAPQKPAELLLSLPVSGDAKMRVEGRVAANYRTADARIREKATVSQESVETSVLSFGFSEEEASAPSSVSVQEYAKVKDEVSRSWQRPQVFAKSAVAIESGGDVSGGSAFQPSPAPVVMARTAEPARLARPEPSPYDNMSSEAYAQVVESEFSSVSEKPLSTFSIDVDTASYTNVRRMLKNGMMPPADAVKAESFINYFSYGYKGPDAKSEVPFNVIGGLACAPWNENNILMRIGVKARDIEWSQRPPSNLVFLVDVSGSMQGANRLGLVKEALVMLTNKLDRRDRVAIVTYANSVTLALPSTTADNAETIAHTIESLRAAGGTSGEGGIELAYEVAQKSMIKGGINRIIVCSDGDFNIGKSSPDQLKEMIKEKAKSGVFLSVAGFGMGNYKDNIMEALAQNGNGNYSYIDSIDEARKVFASEAAGKLNCMAKDVKIQVEFNPQLVKSYKLIGYENRRLAAEDFNDDKKDAGDAGAGDNVTAIYEIVPADSEDARVSAVDELKYSKVESRSQFSSELATVKIRWKEPQNAASEKVEFAVNASAKIPQITDCDDDFKFALSAAMFALKLRGSAVTKNTGYSQISDLAKSALGEDSNGMRTEFLSLVRKASQIDSREK